jgi:peroxiredoxin
MIFKEQIQSIQFKTFYHNQMQMLGYDDIFENSRTLVFSVPAPIPSIKHFMRFDTRHQELMDKGITKIVCVSSDYILIGPWADKQSKVIRGLSDTNKEFAVALSKYYQIEKPLDHLARFWQYTVIVNNGEPEHLWQNPIKVDTAWSIIKHPEFRYHGCGPRKVIEYLDNGIEK